MVKLETKIALPTEHHPQPTLRFVPGRMAALIKKLIQLFQQTANGMHFCSQVAASANDCRFASDHLFWLKSGLLRTMVFGQKPNLLSNSDLITSQRLGSIQCSISIVHQAVQIIITGIR